MERLYAVGETSCNGVHGKNRLASNSLLESMVFAKRAAREIITLLPEQSIEEVCVELSKYQDTDALKEEYKALVLEEIEKERASHE